MVFPWSDWLMPSSNQNRLKPWKSFDDLPAKNLSQVYSSYDIVRKTTLGLFRSFGYREADFEAIYENGSNTSITMGIFTRLLFHFEPQCKLWPEQLLKITEDNNEILLKFIQHNCPSIHRGKFKTGIQTDLKSFRTETLALLSSWSLYVLGPIRQLVGNWSHNR